MSNTDKQPTPEPTVRLPDQTAKPTPPLGSRTPVLEQNPTRVVATPQGAGVIGGEFAGCRILEKVGAGGFGEVYRCRSCSPHEKRSG